MTSTKKDFVLTQIRSRYESKFGASESLSQILNSELSKISKKDKITSEDLNELENKLSQSVHVTSRAPNRIDATPRKNLFSPRQLRLKNTEIDSYNTIKSAIAQSPLNLIDKRGSSIANLKSTLNELSTSTTLPPIATNHLHPMELRILRSYESLPGNEKSPSPSKIDESIGHRSPIRGGLSPKKVPDLSGYRLPMTYKTDEREKQMKQNIWKVIDDHNRKRAEEEEQMRVDRSKKQREVWIQNLNKQVADKQKRNDEQKTKETEDAQRHIEHDIQIRVEKEEKEQIHKRNMKSIERDNHLAAAREKEEIKRIKSLEREKEKLDMTLALEDYSKEQKKLQEEKDKRRKKLMSMKTQDFALQNKRLQEKRAQEKEDDVIANQMIAEKLKQDEQKSADFLRLLKERAKNVKDAEPAAEKGYDNLRKYGKIGTDEFSDGMMHFLYVERHNEEVQNEKKKKNQALLKDKYAHQMDEKIEKSRLYKSYIDEQKDLWKKEEEEMNLREEAGTKVKKLKKYALREDLDAQIEVDNALKNSFITPTEVWVNRKILKELKAIPDKFSDKISYLRDL